MVSLSKHTLLIAKDGTEWPIDDSAAPVRNESGNVIGAVLVFRDITERKIAEQHVKEQGERLRTKLASIGDAVITTDVEGRITGMNSVAEKLTGWSFESEKKTSLAQVFQIRSETSTELVSDPLSWFLGDPSSPGNSTAIQNAILISKDRSERMLNVNASSIRTKEGDILGNVLVFKVISQRRKLERQVVDQLSNAKFLASIIECSQDSILRTSLNGTIQTWNHGAQQLFGHTAEEAIGKPIFLLIPSDRMHEEHQIMAQIRAGERVDHYETVRLRKDGSLLDISLSVSPIHDEAGQVIVASKIARDITKQKQAESL